MVGYKEIKDKIKNVFKIDKAQMHVDDDGAVVFCKDSEFENYKRRKMELKLEEEKRMHVLDKETNIKALVFSDNHGSMFGIYDAIQAEKDVDLVIHCGDLCKDVSELKSYVECPVVAVSGNCDSYSCGLPSAEKICLGAYELYISHGHNNYVSYNNYETLANYASMNGCNVAVFGHIHIPVNEVVKNVRVINPGSIERPRTGDGVKTYGVLRIDEKGQLSFEIKSIS